MPYIVRRCDEGADNLIFKLLCCVQASESMSIDESDAPAADRDEPSSKTPIAADE